MKLSVRDNLIGALAAELTVDAMVNRGFLHVSEDNSVVCAGTDWQHFVAPLQISNEFIGAAKIDRSTDDALFGRVKIFRVKDLTWQSEDPGFDEHRAVAQTEFLLVNGFGRTGKDYLANSYGTAVDELARSILNDLIIQTGAEIV